MQALDIKYTGFVKKKDSLMAACMVIFNTLYFICVTSFFSGLPCRL